MMGSEAVSDLGVADVVDAMAKAFGHRAHVINLKSPNPDRVLFGPAVTIGFLPVRKDYMDPQKHSLGPAFYRAISSGDPKGKVLVMASHGHPNTSLGGGTKLSRVQNHGMAGVLCDGMLRDFEELNGYDFATYCTGETVRAGGGEIQPYLINEPVAMGGVTVTPGDYIFAHGNAAVVIPAAAVEKVIAMAHKIMAMMDKAKASFVGEDPQNLPTQGSVEP